jgi:hypothetical protein
MSERSERINDTVLSLPSSEDGIPVPPKAAV